MQNSFVEFADERKVVEGPSSYLQSIVHVGLIM
jgi:hypothetical protein